MTVKELADKQMFKVTVWGNAPEKAVISNVFCCDLLSLAMGRAPAGCVWVTVISNINTLAVAALADAACIVLAENVSPDDKVIAKAKEKGITVLQSEKPVFEAALSVWELIK